MAIHRKCSGGSERVVSLSPKAPWPWNRLSARAHVDRHIQPGVGAYTDELYLEPEDFDRTWTSVREAWENASDALPGTSEHRDGYSFGYRNLYEDEAHALVLVPAYLQQLEDVDSELAEARAISLREQVALVDGERFGRRWELDDAALLIAAIDGALASYERARLEIVALYEALESDEYRLEAFLERSAATFDRLSGHPDRFTPSVSGGPLPEDEWNDFFDWGAGLWHREQMMLLGVSLIGRPGDETLGGKMLDRFLEEGWLTPESQRNLASTAPVGRFSGPWFDDRRPT